MELERQENAEKDEFFEECLIDPTLRDQMSLLTRKFKNESQVSNTDQYSRLYKALVIPILEYAVPLWSP